MRGRTQVEVLNFCGDLTIEKLLLQERMAKRKQLSNLIKPDQIGGKCSVLDQGSLKLKGN